MLAAEARHAPFRCRRERERSLSHRRLRRAEAGDVSTMRPSRSLCESFLWVTAWNLSGDSEIPLWSRERTCRRGPWRLEPVWWHLRFANGAFALLQNL